MCSALLLLACCVVAVVLLAGFECSALLLLACFVVAAVLAGYVSGDYNSRALHFPQELCIELDMMRY